MPVTTPNPPDLAVSAIQGHSGRVVRVSHRWRGWQDDDEGKQCEREYAEEHQRGYGVHRLQFA